MALEAINRLPQHSNFAKEFGPERCVNTVTGPNQSDRARIKMTDAPISGNAPHVQEIISRAEAKAHGLKRYFTGEPCARGHVAERQTANCICLICKNEKRKIFVRKNPKAVAEVNARHYYANREAMIARAARVAKENPERNRANARQYYARHKEKYSAHSRNRKARIRNADGHHTAAQILALFEKQKGKCTNCKTCLKAGYHVDHIMPLSRGGSNWITNIQLLCPPCNLTKKAMLPDDWARLNGRLV